MKKAKRWISTGLAALMTLGLTACGPKFDPSAYVKAALDTVTRNECESFAGLTKISREEAEKIYTDNLKQAASMLNFMNLSDELSASCSDYMKEVLAKTKYTVLPEAEKTENGYTVKVEVEPLKAFDGAAEAITAKTEAYVAEITEAIGNGADEPTEEEITAVIFESLMEHLNTNLAAPQYGEKQTVVVKVEKNQDGLYEITADSFKELDAALIDTSELNFE